MTASPLACPAAPCTRVGLIVPKLGHTAVARNRLKRRLRDLARLHLLPSRLPVDIVIRIRTGAYAVSYEELRRNVHDALVQLGRAWPARADTGATESPPAPPPSP